jgi:hypothetical protein
MLQSKNLKDKKGTGGSSCWRYEIPVFVGGGMLSGQTHVTLILN